MRKILFFVLVLLVIIPLSQAKLLDTPEAVSYLEAKVTKTGSAYLGSQGFGANAAEVRIKLSIPQDTGTQSTELVSVTGPDEYEYSVDDFGNEIMEVVWENPALDTYLNYTLVFDVIVTDSQDSPSGKGFPLTGMVKATPEMKQKAYELTQGLGEKESMMKLGSWVYDWVDYDRAYQGAESSAGWVYINRKSVCDGHSNLLISMLRALGYNAYYVIGYAYTEENLDPINPNYWGPHGWVEVEHEGELLTIDPTWAESPVDATHIKFANTPDSNYTEYVEMLASRVSLNWERHEPLVTMKEKGEGGRVSTENMVIPGTLKPDSYGMIITDISAGTGQKCVLGRLSIKSCKSEDGDDFFSLGWTENEVYFCDNGRVYWILGAPFLQQGVEYTCPVSIYGMGVDERLTIPAIAGVDEGGVSISTKKTLLPGQDFNVSAVVENHGLMGLGTKAYLLFDGEAYTKSSSIPSGGEETVVWSLEAPQSPGDYVISVFSSTGDYAEEEVSVVSVRYISIANISYPEETRLGDAVHVNVTVKGLEEARIGRVAVSLDGEEDGMEFMIGPDKEKTFLLIFEPGEEGRKDLSVDIFSGERYEAGFSGSVNVVKEETFLEGIIRQIQEFFSWIVMTITGAFG
jgi:transglutaminase-like putative cysteine protease